MSDLGIDRLITVKVAEALLRTAGDMGAGANQQVRAFVAGMTVGAKGDMQRVNRAVAAEMRSAVRARYNATVEATRHVPPYHRSGRLSGHLGRLVRRSDLVRADGEGIQFVNENAMDKEAAHWRRLNFGAGAVAGEQPGPYQVRLFGEASIPVSFGIGASPSFQLPRGFFIQGNTAVLPNASYRGRGSVGPFMPSRRSPYRPAQTVGIRGRHFLEAGLEVMERELPKRYADLLVDWIHQGGRKAKAITRATGI